MKRRKGKKMHATQIEKPGLTDAQSAIDEALRVAESRQYALRLARRELRQLKAQLAGSSEELTRLNAEVETLTTRLAALPRQIAHLEAWLKRERQ